MLYNGTLPTQMLVTEVNRVHNNYIISFPSLLLNDFFSHAKKLQIIFCSFSVDYADRINFVSINGARNNVGCHYLNILIIILADLWYCVYFIRLIIDKLSISQFTYFKSALRQPKSVKLVLKSNIVHICIHPVMHSPNVNWPKWSSVCFHNCILFSSRR